MAFVNDDTDHLNPATVDRERNIILKDIPPSGPDPIYPFVLDWHGQEIKFSGEPKVENYQNDHGEWNFNYDWKIFSITVPDNFPESKEIISQVIVEALEAYGEGHYSERIGHVNVTITHNAFKGRGFI